MNVAFLPQFVAPILANKKPHTVRRDVENKMIPGKTLHLVHAQGYRRFAVRKVVSTQKFEVCFTGKQYAVLIDDRELSKPEFIEFALADGFKSFAEFEAFFNKNYLGKIIHWTPLRYGKS